jgi:heme-degrading monooxygenase HmoA
LAAIVATLRRMIVRTWSATATPAGADGYRRYFEGTLLAHLRGLDGFAGAYLLSRVLAAAPAPTTELTTHTFWESLAAIRAFAGDDFGTSVVEPEARACLLDFDSVVTHRELWIDRGA